MKFEMAAADASLNREDLSISCPYCRGEIRLSEAVSHRLREQISGEFAIRLEAQQKTLAEREEQLHQKQTELDHARLSVESEVAGRLNEEKVKLLATARQQVQGQFAAEVRDLRNQLSEQHKRLSEAQEAELSLRRKQRVLEEQKQALELDVTRKLDEERGQIREAAKLQATEEQRFRLAEKEKLIADLQKQIDSLKQRIEQGSMQMQGEVLEIDLEERLRATFISDLLEPVAKGVRGADILQRVRSNAGLECGSILWETKRTKAFGKDWVAKLKEDQRAAHADFAIIVTQAMPPELRSFGALDGVWVCDYACALPLAAALRQGLVGMAVAHQTEVGKHSKMEQLYRFLSGLEFRQHIEALVESFIFLQEQIDQERRALTRHWAAREKQLEAMMANTAGLYGSIQGIVGRGALPEITVLQLGTPTFAAPSSSTTGSQFPTTAS
ncbi:MAG: DUF2130 domain-containing protein [Verrucomicrobiota bacterium]